MAARRKISYDAAIASVMKKHFSNSKMNKSGRELIEEILQNIHSSLLENFDSEYESLKEINDTAVTKCVGKAVSKTLPTVIRTHAMAEASRQLTLYQQGLLEYDHVASIKALKALPEYSAKGGKSGAAGETKRAVPAYRPFATAANRIVSVIYPNMKLDSEAKQFLGIHLHRLANDIAAKAAVHAAEKQVLESADVRESLPEFLSSEVLNLAYGEANRNLLHHVQGIRVFRPRKPTTDQQPVMSVAEAMSKTKKSTDLAATPIVKAVTSTIFRDEIRKLLSLVMNIHPPPKIDEGGKTICDVLFSIADFLSNKVAERSLNNNLTAVDFTDVSEVINENFPQVLYRHAVYYGIRNVKDLLQGILKYKKKLPRAPKAPSAPQDTKSKIESSKRRSKSRTESSKRRSKSKSPASKRRSRSKAPASKRKIKVKDEPVKRSRKNEKVELTKTKDKVKPKELNFSKGILCFVQQSFSSSSVSVGREGTERINSYMLDVCNALITECASQHTTMTAEAMRATAVNILPRQIARHALALADKFLCDSGDPLVAAHSAHSGVEKEIKTETTAPEIKTKTSAAEIKQEPTEEPEGIPPSTQPSTETVTEPYPDEETSNE